MSLRGQIGQKYDGQKYPALKGTTIKLPVAQIVARFSLGRI